MGSEMCIRDRLCTVPLTPDCGAGGAVDFVYVPGGFLSSPALTSLQMDITAAPSSENAKQGAPLRPPEPLTSISSDFAQYPRHLTLKPVVRRI